MSDQQEFFYGGLYDERLSHDDPDEYVWDQLDIMDEDPETKERSDE